MHGTKILNYAPASHCVILPSFCSFYMNADMHICGCTACTKKGMELYFYHNNNKMFQNQNKGVLLWSNCMTLYWVDDIDDSMTTNNIIQLNTISLSLFLLPSHFDSPMTNDEEVLSRVGLVHFEFDSFY